MMDFDLARRFDIVTCLFSAIGYVRTIEGLRRAIGCMTRHILPGGLLIIEPWFRPQDWLPDTVHAQFIDEPEFKLARINTSLLRDGMSVFDLHHLIGTPRGTEHVVEHHELGLFETHEMLSAMAETGLSVEHDPQGLTGRGLFIGWR
jgi:hypothetical protein